MNECKGNLTQTKLENHFWASETVLDENSCILNKISVNVKNKKIIPFKCGHKIIIFILLQNLGYTSCKKLIYLES